MVRHKQEDAYYFKAKKDGYVARSVYKLIEMDQRYKLFKRKQKILDLGCHPGSWLQYAIKKTKPQGLIVGVDIKFPIISLPLNTHFILKDILSIKEEDLRQISQKYDLILSDVAQKKTGIKSLDLSQNTLIIQKILDIALNLLKKNGDLVIKSFHGETLNKFIKKMKKNFKIGKAYKTQITSKGSNEIYLIGKNYKGQSYITRS